MTLLQYWGGSNINVTLGTDGVDQPGLGTQYQRISTSKNSTPLEDDVYYITWDSNNYLAFEGGNVVFAAHDTAPEGDEYKWKVVLDHVDYLSNYYTVQNCGDTKFYLEVMKGPTAPQQEDNDGKKYIFMDNDVTAQLIRDYDGYDRKPGFTIFEKGGTFCLLPGNNEKRSELKKDNDSASVYIIKDKTTADYHWSFVEAPYETVALNGVKEEYDLSTTSFSVAIECNADLQRDIFVTLKEKGGSHVVSDTVTVEPGLNHIDLTLTAKKPFDTLKEYEFLVALRQVGGDWTKTITTDTVPVAFSTPPVKLSLAKGYQLISLDVMPVETNIKTLFSSVLGSIEFIEDEKGNQLKEVKGSWVNGLNAFDPSRAYLVKAKGSVDLIIDHRGAASLDLELRNGVNLIPTRTDSAETLEALFSSVLDTHIVWIRDTDGNYLRKVNGRWINSLLDYAMSLLAVENMGCTIGSENRLILASSDRTGISGSLSLTAI